jgi:cytochrome c-type biogenesis protein CcmH
VRFTLVFLGIFILLTACGKRELDPEARVEKLGSEIRCPVCRGVPIADSPSTLALEMMQVLREQIAQGKSDEEVLKYFEERYGEWALLKPKPEGMNLVIWILPALFLLGGGVGIVIRLKKGEAK